MSVLMWRNFTSFEIWGQTWLENSLQKNFQTGVHKLWSMKTPSNRWILRVEVWKISDACTLAGGQFTGVTIPTVRNTPYHEMSRAHLQTGNQWTQVLVRNSVHFKGTVRRIVAMPGFNLIHPSVYSWLTALALVRDILAKVQLSVLKKNWKKYWHPILPVFSN